MWWSRHHPAWRWPAWACACRRGWRRRSAWSGTAWNEPAHCHRFPKVNQSQRTVVKSIVLIFFEGKSNVELLRWIAWGCTCLLYHLKEQCLEIFRKGFISWSIIRWSPATSLSAILYESAQCRGGGPKCLLKLLISPRAALHFMHFLYHGTYLQTTTF